MKLAFDSNGLIPAIAQDARTGRVLMLAWVNQEALTATLSTGYAHYFSRSRQSLWKKGESSGHVQEIVDIRLDCDGDSLLYAVNQSGPACHTNEASCFFNKMNASGEFHAADAPESGTMERLQSILHDRREASPDSSYTARLLQGGVAAIQEKILEEAGELCVALENESHERVVSETADLLYHVLVGLESRGVLSQEIALELAGRFGVSGLQEKARRK
ncbi:MAG TPA: bifunctional phosphoribosyl-AMP cyclohydrolase/phosphoribosyl-ATP diphosphatase HisIE [Myxococcales bacterium]|nr:bifunctional phosphoribosyl-AMP cyclohydrolase/phosphoribosyl-ATP diphosphatase HisIE [Myxococcales bacterium]HIN85055.1 bifunctional phosphoribosyl-AMP cyclohydrolase/phosphoribosyl-ATP diphosphatase HisIE [Myxococcales bacterium]HIO21561.1 bifunctional phosphoribosyl-AMP cyclohydrolase/phosphoribosyl-ATP diphosphatase HisIE [Nitrospirales bacterium]